MVANSILRQKVGIPIGTDAAPFRANLFLYTYKNATKRFIDDLGTLNGGGAFSHVYKGIYPSELQLKVEHSGTHATFLNLNVTVKDGEFVYKLFGKRDAFPFLLFVWLILIVTFLN